MEIETYKPTDRQIQAHVCPARYIMYGGGLGGGKTKFICEDAVSHMIKYPGNRGFIGRAVLTDFRITTKVELDKTLEKYVEAGLVKENKSEMWYKFYNGSILWYGGLDQDTGKGSGLGKKNKLFSAEFGWIGMDQAEELTKDQFEKTASRLRHTLPDGSTPPYRYILTANPAQNWIKARFITAPDSRSAFIPALATDNPHLPKGYVDELKSLFASSEDYLEALIKGSWDSIAAIDDLLKMSEIQLCFGDWVNRHYEHRVISIDPARFGDDMTVIFGWQNECPLERITYGKQDSEFTLGKALQLEKQMGGNALFVIDDTGGYGSGIVDSLNACYSEFGEDNPRVIAVNFGSAADDKEHYFNKRAELYYNAAMMIKRRQIAIPKEYVDLHGQLAGMKYKFERGRIKLPPKAIFKDQFGKSPDDADSFVLGAWGCKLLADGIIRVKAPWEEQKPAWQKAREEMAWQREERMAFAGNGQTESDMDNNMFC